ncbi:MAG: phospholipase D-like domain-containing protein [Methanomassiliicoccaceae archaeon]|nr:phospholipase D-like domain-containing protein [Methanomassiliicoccaceae archaeon]
MDKTKCLIAISFLLLSPILFIGDASSGDDTENILLYEVQPYGSYEGVSIFNYGSAEVNLKGWSLTDREGTLAIVKDLRIGPGTRLTFVKAIDPNDWFSGRESVIAFNDGRIQKSGSFILADAGDDVYLYRGNVLIDAVCYGNKTADAGWIGDPVKMPSGKYLLRTGPNDTDSLSDWVSTKPGVTNYFFDPDLFFDADVTPFSFPESGGAPIFKEMEKAEKEILISIYLLSSVQLVALLCDLAENGVSVRVLIEGDMLGDNGFGTELTLMRSLVDAGGEVCLINDPVPGNFERYTYVHNKYAVIDERTVILTSENWTQSNLSMDEPSSSNRGWGVVMESTDLAMYFKNIFLNDADQRYGDVHSLLDYSPGVKPYSGTLTYSGEPSSYETATFEARVMPVLSPDNSHSALRYFIDNAETRVYSQQMDLGSSYRALSDKSPLKWMSDAADRGADARLILDATFNKKTTEEIVDGINVTTNIKALAVSGRASVFGMTHNKGVVIDDLVWVASVNWTENSFMNNREAAVLIDSPDVAEFFAGLFVDDWGVNKHTIEEEGLEITMEELSLDEENLYAFTVSGPIVTTYKWDVLGNGEIRTSSINKIVCRDLPSGTYTLTVTMDGTDHSASLTYTAEAVAAPTNDAGSNLIWVAVAFALAALGGVAALIRKRTINP